MSNLQAQLRTADLIAAFGLRERDLNNLANGQLPAAT
jgi:hypothetical protein